MCNSDPKTRKEHGLRYKVAVGFMLFVVISSFIAWFVMSHANNTLKSSHDVILSHHKKSSELTDSMISFTNLLLKDSTVKSVDKVIICQRLEDAANSFSSQENEQKTINLLELEFSKIQNEYEVLNLWCALLTVVFLIFSFFSIFKTNELSNQGEEALVRLRQTASEAKQKSDDIDIKILESKKKIASEEKILIDKFRKSLENDISLLNEKLKENKKENEEVWNKIGEKKKEISKLVSENKELLENVPKNVQEIIENIEMAIPDKISETILSETRISLSNIFSKIDELSNTVDVLKKEFANIQTNSYAGHTKVDAEVSDLETDVDEREHDDENDDPKEEPETEVKS